jgi:hypothetical protein
MRSKRSLSSLSHLVGLRVRHLHRLVVWQVLVLVWSNVLALDSVLFVAFEQV